VQKYEHLSFVENYGKIPLMQWKYLGLGALLGFATVFMLYGEVFAPESVPQEEALRVFEYRCDNESFFTVQFGYEGKATVSLSGIQFELELQPSASGARYVGKNYEYWFKGAEAMVTDLNTGLLFATCATTQQ
jgi:membrane-bound inhibitor of C-type lysozyme